MAVNVFNAELVKEIVQSAEETIPKTTGARRTKNVPWWTDECSIAIKNEIKHLGNFKNVIPRIL